MGILLALFWLLRMCGSVVSEDSTMGQRLSDMRMRSTVTAQFLLLQTFESRQCTAGTTVRCSSIHHPTLT